MSAVTGLVASEAIKTGSLLQDSVANIMDRIKICDGTDSSLAELDSEVIGLRCDCLHEFLRLIIVHDILLFYVHRVRKYSNNISASIGTLDLLLNGFTNSVIMSTEGKSTKV
jgi:hypothetical protein